MKIFAIFQRRLEQSYDSSNDKRRPMCGSTRSGEGRRGKKGNDDDDAHTPPTLPPSFSFILSTSLSRAHTHTHQFFFSASYSLHFFEKRNLQ
jgi:hypothetical protein